MDRKSGRLSLMRSRIKSFPICSILVVLAVLLSICSPSPIQEGLRSSIPGEADQYKSHQEALDVARRSLTIGSTPPACTGRCGRCTPCKAVAVTVPPGARHVTKEYYPSVWRCQCGGKLYMLGRPPPATDSSPGRVVNLPID